VATPAFHHWHHTNDGPNVVDKNCAATLPWVDWIFGTFHLPRDKLPVHYGTTYPMPAGMGDQLSQPFMPDGPEAPIVDAKPHAKSETDTSYCDLTPVVIARGAATKQSRSAGAPAIVLRWHKIASSLRSSQ